MRCYDPGVLDWERNSRLYGNGHRKYQFMEVNTQRRAAGLKDKIPDIQKTLDTVRFLKTREVRGTVRGRERMRGRREADCYGAAIRPMQNPLRPCSSSTTRSTRKRTSRRRRRSISG